MNMIDKRYVVFYEDDEECLIDTETFRVIVYVDMKTVFDNSEGEKPNCELYVTQKNNGRYVSHRVDGPSYIWENQGYGGHEFRVNGILTSVEQLPCDEETKVLLKLKYG